MPTHSTNFSEAETQRRRQKNAEYHERTENIDQLNVQHYSHVLEFKHLNFIVDVVVMILHVKLSHRRWVCMTSWFQMHTEGKQKQFVFVHSA